MIVKCEQCQTRFKIPDDKVSDKGVKVRCTKCQHTFRVTRDGSILASGQAPTLQVPAVAQTPEVPPVPPVAHVPVPAARTADPFAKFGAALEEGMGDTTRPGVYALGVEASRKPGPPLQPSFAAQKNLPPEVFEQQTRVSVLPLPPSGRRPLREAVPQEPSPFDFAAALGNPEPPPPAHFDFGKPIEPPEQPAPQVPAAYEAKSQTSITELSAAHDPFANIELESGEQTLPAAPTPTEPEVPSVFGPDGGDFFASTQPVPSAPSLRPDALGLSDERQVETDTSQRAALFEMPPPEPNRVPEGFNSLRLDSDVSPVGNRQLTIAVGAPVEESERLEAVRPKRRVAWVIINVAIASVLVVLLTVVATIYLSEGKVELASFGIERLKATFSTPTDWVTLDISNGLYDTRAGRPVFFVRGDVKNRSGKATRVRIRAEILDGNTTIRHADVWVGLTPSPEDLYLIAVADDVERLLSKLEKAAAELMPDEKRSFLVPFFEYPPDLSGFRVRVTVLESAPGETAAR